MVNTNLNSLHFLLFFCTILTITPTFGQSLENILNKDKNILILDSDLESVLVLINDSLVGITPVKLIDFPDGIYNIDFVYDTLVVKKFGVDYKKNRYQEICGIFNKNKALLTIYSEPSNASVFLDDSLIGYTPINKKYVDRGVYNLSVFYEDHTIWNKRILLLSELYQYKVKLINNFGYVEFIQDDSSQYFIDNSPVKPGSSFSYKLSVGEHKVGVSSDSYHKDFDDIIDVKPDENQAIKFNYGTTSYNNLLYSALLPGLGQIKDNSSSKGYRIMGANIVLAGLAVYFALDYNSKLDTYENKIDSYNNEQNEFLVLRTKEEMLNAYDETETALKYRNYSIGAFLIAYIYNLVDAYLNHSISGDFIISSDYLQSSANISLKVKL